MHPDIVQIKSKIRRGDQLLIAQKLNKSPSWISQVLAGVATTDKKRKEIVNAFDQLFSWRESFMKAA